MTHQITPTVESKKVCPHCGNDVFIWDVSSQRIVLCNSEKQIITTLTESPLTEDDGIPMPICQNCENEIKAFVTPEFFYQEICNDEFEDTLPCFIGSAYHDRATGLISEDYKITRRDPLTWSIANAVHPHGWLLVIEVVQTEVGVRYGLRGRVLTHEMVTSEHMRTIPHPDVVVECPPAVAGRYVFTLNDKKYAVHLMLEEFTLQPLMSLEEVKKLPNVPLVENEGITIVTHGDTEGNEQPQYNGMWRLLKFAPGSGGVLDDTFQEADKAKMRQKILDAMDNGYTTDDMILEPPSRSVDIDQFIKEGSE